MILNDQDPKYDEYYQKSLELLREGGLIILDNVSDDVNQQLLPVKSLVENFVSVKFSEVQTEVSKANAIT